MTGSTPEPNPQISEDLAATISQWGEDATRALTDLLVQTTAGTGEFLESVAENPVVKTVTGLPVLNRLPTFLGEVNRDRARETVARIRAEMPTASPGEIAERIMVDTALQAAGVGLVTNIVPPIALALFAVDLAAVTQLQVEMVYRIAAAYEFPLDASERRGEVLAIFGLSLGGSGILKAGLGFIEVVPGVGAVIGASTNAILIYSLGYTACRYYEARQEMAGESSNFLQTTEDYLQQAVARQAVMDQLLAHVVIASNPRLSWPELSPQLQRFALTTATAEGLASLEDLEPVDRLLDRLDPRDVRPLLARCEKIVQYENTISITPEAGALLAQIAARVDDGSPQESL